MLDFFRNYRTFFVLVAVAASILLVSEACLTDSREEEADRNDVALQMLQTDNWLVPYRFGIRYLKKPPGLNWLIAGFSLPFGTVTDFSARIPIMLLYLLFPAVVFFLIVPNFSTLGRLTAASSSVLFPAWFIEKGPIMEIDLVFTFFVVLALGLWLYYDRKNSPYLKWSVSQLAAAAAFMVKGPVIFIFYYPAVFLYLFTAKRKRFHPGAFLLGLVLFCAPVLSWFVATLEQVSLTEWWNVAIQEMSGPARRNSQVSGFVEHLLKFPLETVFSFFPWILFLLPLVSSPLRKSWNYLRQDSYAVKFSLCTLPVWVIFFLLPDADIRYILPLYPYIGVLCASMLELTPTGDLELEPWLDKIRYILTGILGLATLALPFILLDAGRTSPLIITVSVLFLVGCIVSIWKIRWMDRPLGNIVLASLILILAVKTVHLFVFLPADEPNIYTRTDYTKSIEQYLQDNDIHNICMTAGGTHWKFFYLHRSFPDLFHCNPNRVETPGIDWIIINEKLEEPLDPRLKLHKTFTMTHHAPTYIYQVNRTPFPTPQSK